MSKANWLPGKCEICGSPFTYPENQKRFTCSAPCNEERHRRQCRVREHQKMLDRRAGNAGADRIKASAEVRAVLEKDMKACHVFIPPPVKIWQTAKCPGCPAGQDEHEVYELPSPVQLRIYCDNHMHRRARGANHGYGVAL